MKRGIQLEANLTINNDLLLAAYFMKENAWEGVNQTNFHRVLYFSAVLAPVFLEDEEWGYNFFNTLFGPSNITITEQLRDLSAKGFLELVNINVYSNRIEEKYLITNEGREYCDKVLFMLKNKEKRVLWFKIIIKVLSIYGENFLARLIKEEPNLYSQRQENIKAKLNTDNSENNLSKEFFEFLKERGKEKYRNNSLKNEDYLLLFFDVLYRKYKEEI